MTLSEKTSNKSHPCACNEGIGYSGDLAPQILNLGTTWDNSDVLLTVHLSILS